MVNPHNSAYKQKDLPDSQTDNSQIYEMKFVNYAKGWTISNYY